MASFRVSAMPEQLLRSPCPIRLQRRWARVHDARFFTVRRHNSDRTIEKYRSKLDQKAKEEGHDSIDSLKKAYQDKISGLRLRAAANPSSPNSGPVSSTYLQNPPSPPRPRDAGSTNGTGSAGSTPGVKPLSAYLDLDKVATLPKQELEYIWRLRHASDPLSLCAVIPIATYQRIYRTAQRHPQFILPVPRSTAPDGGSDAKQAAHGFEAGRRSAADIHFLQWMFYPPAVPPPPHSNTLNTHTSTAIFTHLASFKAYGSYAQPHTTVIHHLDLADSHGLVLLNGAVGQGKGLSVQEGRWLVWSLQKFYDSEGQDGHIDKSKRRRLLEKFSQGDQSFQLEELLHEAERVS